VSLILLTLLAERSLSLSGQPRYTVELTVPLETVLAPEDAGGVAVDLVEEIQDVGGGLGKVVLVEPEVPVAPVQRP
jgi:hypothetical protein